MYLVAAGPFLACHDELLRACEYSQQMWTAILCSSTPVLHRLDRRPLDDAPSQHRRPLWTCLLQRPYWCYYLHAVCWVRSGITIHESLATISRTVRLQANCPSIRVVAQAPNRLELTHTHTTTSTCKYVYVPPMPAS